MKQFPEGYPENLMDQIYELGGKFEAINVYRVLKYRISDQRSFWSTYQEIQEGLLIPNKELGIGDYSTSCNTSLKKMKEYLTLSSRKHPRATIGVGYTAPCCGPMQKEKTKTHVHWWVFKDSEPWKHFKEMSENDE